MVGDGTIIAGKGWPARKFYLSAEAIALMENHCKGTPLSMSAYLDMLIKRDLAPFRRVEPGEFEQRDLFTTQDGTVLPAVAKRIAEVESKTDRPPRDPREPLGQFQKVKQPTKKDFDLDV